MFRLGHRRGMGSARTLGKQAGIVSLETRAGTNDVAYLVRLAEAADVPLANLLAISYGSDEPGRAVFRGRTISASLLDGSTMLRRVCPQCLVESPYHRAAWDLSFSSACPAHHRMMVNACPDCGEPLRWRGVDLTLCGCSGGVLTRAQSPAVPSETLDGLRLAWGILGDDRFGDDVAGALELPVFDRMPEMAVLEFVYRLGMDLSPGQRRKHFSLENPVDLDEEPHVALHRGLSAAQSWPDGLGLAYASVKAKDWTEPSKTVSRRWFNAVAAWARALPPGPGHDIWSALETLMRNEGIGASWHSLKR